MPQCWRSSPTESLGPALRSRWHSAAASARCSVRSTRFMRSPNATGNRPALRSPARCLAPPLPQIRGLAALGAVAVRQLRDVLDAYRDNDAEAAERIRARDAELDLQYTSLFRELLTYMMEDARSITPCTHLLFMAKNIERIGDHATNIAEMVYYAATGQHMTEAQTGKKP